MSIVGKSVTCASLGGSWCLTEKIVKDRVSVFKVKYPHGDVGWIILVWNYHMTSANFEGLCVRKFVTIGSGIEGVAF